MASKPVLVKVRSHLHEKASYTSCSLHIDGNQLRLVRRGGGSAEIIVLSSHRVFSMIQGHGRFYVVIESGDKVVKLKVETAEAQRRWMKVLESAFSFTLPSSAFPTPWPIKALEPDQPAASLVGLHQQAFDFTNGAIGRLTSAFQRDSLVDTGAEDPGTPSSVSSAAHSGISSSPAIPIRSAHSLQSPRLK